MYKGKKVVHITARGMDGEIGANNKLLWNIPEDLEFFRDNTIGHVVLMGRNTFESLPKPLPKRINLVVSKKDYDEEDKDLALNYGMDDSIIYSNLLNNDKFFIIGGSQLYNSTFDIADELWVTQVKEEYPEADTNYNIPLNFEMYSESEPISCLDRTSGECINIKFQKWRRK